MRLAAMMHRTVAELGRTMSSEELSEWMAFDSEYGLPDIYFATGLICAVLNNLWSGKARTPEEFIPFFHADEPAQSSADHARFFSSLAGRAAAQGIEQKATKETKG